MSGLETGTVQSDDRRRVRSSMGLSLVVHLTILALLIVQKPGTDVALALTEVDYLPALAVPSALRAAAEPVVAPPVAEPAESPVRFRRSEPVADVQPEPQSDFALADRMTARLDALRERTANAVVAAALSPVPVRWSAAPAPGSAPAPAPVALTRGKTERAPLVLERGAPVPARLDPATISSPKPRAEAAAPAGASASRQLAGARLDGPVADRPIETHATPRYPEWAKREAVEGSVTLRFFVRADGSIKENVLVQKTAGFEDFDQSAVVALREWRFQPLPAGRTGEQWGTITFHFRLRDAG